MAKPTLNDLNGVSLTVKYSNGETESGKHCAYKYHDVVSIDYTGDIFYMLDKDNNFAIVPVVAKRNLKYVGYNAGTIIYYTSNIEGSKKYVPEYYGDDSKLKSFKFKGKRSHSGLFFTTEDEAKEWQKKIADGKVFATLKKGDKVYMAASETEKPIELTVSNVTFAKDGSDENNVYFGNDGFIRIGETIWEDKTSDQIDTHFYLYKLSEELYNNYNNHRFYINEKDALTSISDAKKRKKKNATDKYIKSLENHDGKPIKHHDSAGKELHYGDKIAYAVARDSSSPFVSIGKIVGETEQKITVEDISGKNDWRTKEKRNVTPYSTFLLEEAKLNVNSGFVFKK